MIGAQRRTIFDWFVHSEVSGSVVLLACTLVALAWANSPWAGVYFALAQTPIALAVGTSTFALSLQHWVNDGLMAVFFFVVGLEIKRELSVGHLSSFRQAVLPVAAALGGMIGPAAIYLAFNASGPGARGWGIPMATDIAFALGILALLGPRVPVALRVFLTALAIADDLGSVLVIAFFYTEEIRWSALGAALVLLPVVALTMRFGIRRPLLMALPIAGVWMAVLASGVHATVAGILVALVVPMRPRLAPADFLATVTGALAALRTADLTRDSVLTSDAQLDALVRLDDVATDMRPPGLTLERVLHPIQALVILPLFALVNAGVDLTGRGLEALADPVTLGVIAGLLLGKPLGIGLSCWLAVQSGHARLPDGVTGLQIAGVGLLGGVGFTMSLFVSELAFGTGPLLGAAKLGILAASSAAGLSGYLVLGAALPRSSSSRAVPATG